MGAFCLQSFSNENPDDIDMYCRYTIEEATKKFKIKGTYQIGDVVVFDTCLRKDVHENQSCPKCNAPCLLTTQGLSSKKSMWCGKVKEIVVLKRTNFCFVRVEVVTRAGNIATADVPFEWVNRSYQQALDDEKLISQFTW